MTSDTIVVSNANGGIPPPPDTRHRAVHQIKRSSLSHNYACVESAANRQKCSVIVVVKADGYGHGAIQTALHLADSCGADAFAVATLEEAIALRKAFELPHNNNHRNGVKRNSVTNLFLAPGTAPTDPRSRSASPITNTRSMRSPHIRILVLGPPVGYPRCFDDYYYYNVEVMVSGPEVAQALMHWVANPAQRKRTLVERAAQEAKQKALSAHPSRQSMIATSICHGTTDDEENSGQDELEEQVKQTAQPHSAATLSNVSGHDLAKEVRAILISQHAAKNQADNHVNTTNGSISFGKPNNSFKPVQPPPSSPPSTPKKGEMFGGIEAAAHTSRMRHIAAAKASEVFVEDDRCETATSSVTSTVVGRAASRVKRRLRWHALVDSGMGRLGFRTEAVPRNDVSGKYDTVDIIKEMVDAEVHTDAPLGTLLYNCSYTVSNIVFLTFICLKLQNFMACVRTWRKPMKVPRIQIRKFKSLKTC
jgi:hypothetical protein